ncbi:hypothetical protein ABZV75_26200 [Streptomyces flaveolus]|uniref:hypothetical protein n=1 Tax=Streptomyces flaveolus TaxID=67297 RepID=UPI0033B28FDE
MTSKPYPTGHRTPAVDEITGTELAVEGALPAELTGRLVRNSHATVRLPRRVTGRIHGS